MSLIPQERARNLHVIWKQVEKYNAFILCIIDARLANKQANLIEDINKAVQFKLRTKDFLRLAHLCCHSVDDVVNLDDEAVTLSQRESNARQLFIVSLYHQLTTENLKHLAVLV